jgi:cytochrome c
MRLSSTTAVAFVIAILVSCNEAPVEPPQSAAPDTSQAPAIVRPATLPSPYDTGDVEAGAAIFARCRNCHSLNPNEGHKIGPNLAGFTLRPPGTAEGFRYSPALEAYAQPSWTPQDLDAWLQDPKGFLPGSSMTFNGIRDDQDRTDLIAFLFTRS